jgi:hypothetical protein
VLRLANGKNTFVLERGLEYRTMRGHFEVERNVADGHRVQLNRFANLRQEGWWSGDLDLQRPVKDVPLLMLADDLHFGIVSSPWPPTEGAQVERPLAEREEAFAATMVGTERLFDTRSYVVDDGETCLIICRLKEPWAQTDENRGWSVIDLARRARQQGAHICVATPTSWDLPTLVALDLVDSLAVIHRQMSTAKRNLPATGYAADRLRYPPPRGLGRWSEDIYIHLLNSGLRIPCVAASGSGTSPNAVGQNRTYVYCGSDFDYDGWWESLKLGRTSITNGPLLRPMADGQPPGHVFHVAAGQELSLQVTLTLSTRTRIDYLELVQNGQTVHQTRLDDLARSSGKLPEVPFTQSGWLAVRAVSTNNQQHEYALSGPFYVELEERPRISKESAEFFLDWVQQRRRQLSRREDVEREALQRLLLAHEEAEAYWRARVQKATAP